MARDYAKIATSLWRSRKFKSLRNNDRARLLYFYLHTCPQVTSCGCFTIPIGYIVADLTWGEQQVVEALETLSEASMIAWNVNEEVILIVDFLRFDQPTNPNHAGSVIKIAMALPDCHEKAITLMELMKNEHCRKSPLLAEEAERLSKAFPKPFLTPNPFPLPEPLPAPQKKEPRAALSPSIVIPTWVPEEPWQGYLALRRQKRAPATPRALSLVIKDLDRLRQEGGDPGDILDNCVKRGWLGIFPINNGGHNGSGSNASKRPAINEHLAGLASLHSASGFQDDRD